MGTMIDITQNKLDHAFSEETAAKIKLRRLSHANLMEHLKNVPYKVTTDPKVKSSNFHLPEEFKEMKVSPKKYMEIVTGKYRPINVKEDKTENIRNHSDSLISLAIENEQVSYNSDADIDESISIPLVAEEETNDVQLVSEVEQEMPQIEENSEEEMNKVEQNVVNISEYIARINNEAQLVKTVKQEADLAQQEALVSDENVNKLSVEVSELEKQEAEAERQNMELDRRVIEAYESQAHTLVAARKEYEELIKEAQERKQNNDNKIVQFQSKIDDIRNHITDVNESIARKQGILSALQQTEISDTNDLIQYTGTDFVNEEKVKKIA